VPSKVYTAQLVAPEGIAKFKKSKKTQTRKNISNIYIRHTNCGHIPISIHHLQKVQQEIAF
jgi:hypothetical protein